MGHEPSRRTEREPQAGARAHAGGRLAAGARGPHGAHGTDGAPGSHGHGAHGSHGAYGAPGSHGTHGSHGHGAQAGRVPRIPVGSAVGRRAAVVSFLLLVMAGLAQGWTLICTGRALGALVGAGVSTTAGEAWAQVRSGVGSALLAAACQGAAELVSRLSATHEEGAVRARALRHLLWLGPGRASSERTGARVSMMTDGAERVSLYRQTFLAPTVAAAVSPAGVLVLMGATIDWLTAGVLLAAVLVIPAFIATLHRVLRRSSAGSRRARTRLSAEYLDAIQGLTTLTLARAATDRLRRLRADGERNRRALMRLLAGNQLVILLTDSLFSLFFVTAAVALALLRLGAGAVSAGEALAIVLLAYVLLEPLDRVGSFFYVAMGGMAHQRALRRLLLTRRPGGGEDGPAGDGPRGSGACRGGSAAGVGRGQGGSGCLEGPGCSEGAEATAGSAASRGSAGASGTEGVRGTAAAEGACPAGDEAGEGARGGGVEVRLEGVSARWEPGAAQVLRDVSLTVGAGEHVAVVGPSGAGKSTLVALLAGDLAPEKGAVRVGEAGSGALEELRRQSAVVAQSTWLFTGTIASNLRLARPQAGEEEMWEALAAARLDEEVRAMPGGLETAVGAGGLGLSGGQAQRLSLARAFLSGRPLLLLDEPTSQVDLDSEALIAAALAEIGRDRTVVTVSHREGAIVGADRLLRVEDGHVTEVAS